MFYGPPHTMPKFKTFIELDKRKSRDQLFVNSLRYCDKKQEKYKKNVFLFP
jgi:hypothetical protein